MLELLRQRAQELAMQSAHDSKAQKKYKSIINILSVDDCFLKIPIEDGYAILKDLGISKENLKTTYEQLI